VSAAPPAEVFVRHLDLTPLRGRRRRVVHCIFHQDSTPSLSVDLDRQVFNCFGCGARGGFKRFAELVGERTPIFAPARNVYLSPMNEARRDALAAERSAEARRAAHRPVWRAAGEYREVMGLMCATRALATAAGPDAPGVWDALELAARAEIDAEAALAEASE
jgi:CHC2 zinc finger